MRRRVHAARHIKLKLWLHACRMGGLYMLCTELVAATWDFQCLQPTRAIKMSEQKRKKKQAKENFWLVDVDSAKMGNSIRNSEKSIFQYSDLCCVVQLSRILCNDDDDDMWEKNLLEKSDGDNTCLTFSDDRKLEKYCAAGKGSKHTPIQIFCH